MRTTTSPCCVNLIALETRLWTISLARRRSSRTTGRSSADVPAHHDAVRRFRHGDGALAQLGDEIGERKLARLQPQLAGAEMGDRQRVLQQLQQLQRTGAHAAGDELMALFALVEHVDVAENDVQRRAQLVRHRVDELAARAQRFLQAREQTRGADRDADLIRHRAPEQQLGVLDGPCAGSAQHHRTEDVVVGRDRQQDQRAAFPQPGQAGKAALDIGGASTARTPRADDRPSQREAPQPLRTRAGGGAAAGGRRPSRRGDARALRPPGRAG